MTGEQLNKVSIKFKPGAYGAYRSINNKPWFALAEYVDNALQSYLSNKETIIINDGPDYRLTISIDINPEEDVIIIRDNAGGINQDNFLRAFEPANIPTDRTGLSEFGMGMKIASIWFADKYLVRTSAINEEVERSVKFDLNKVMREEREELFVTSKFISSNIHFTEVILSGLSHNAPKRLGIQFLKIKKHLASIYRKFLRAEELILKFNGEILTFEEPEILNAPFVGNPNGPNILWKKEINIETPQFSVQGFIGLLKEMSGVNSGLSLFRRGRVIEGSHDEKYFPKILSGVPSSPRGKRLFGELELTGLQVSFDKGSFRQVDELNALLELVKEELTATNFNLLKQGDQYRKPKRPLDINVNGTDNNDLNEQSYKPEDDPYITTSKEEENQEHKVTDRPITSPKNSNKSQFDTQRDTSDNKPKYFRDIIEDFERNGKLYKLNIQVIENPIISNLYELTYEGSQKNINIVGTINLEHPFFFKYKVFQNSDSLEPIIDILKTLIISEVLSLSQGTTMGGNIRINFNKLLNNI